MDFDGTNGANPFGNLMQASDGKLYGMTYGGGSNGVDVIFSFDLSSSTYTKLKDFDHINGTNPQGSLMQASDGKLYGMTLRGGRSGAGVIFSFDPSSSTYTKLKDYDGANGANPYSAFIEVNESNKAPIVKITSPVNGASYTALATILLSADASDIDGTVKTVDFYNGTALIFTETWPPFYRRWYNVPAGNYTITAKATDNKGRSTTSAPVHITVLGPNFLTANITSPGNGASFTAPATFTITADVKGPNEIVKTDFYNGSTLIFSEHLFPYSNKWRNVPAGNYSITAKATDSKGNVATSVPVAITVKSSASATLASNKPVSLNSKTNLRDAVSVQLMPNPANNILNIRTTGLQSDKQLIVSVISASGVIMQAKQFSSSTQTIQLNVSSLVSGVYTIKFLSGDKVLYKQFVKL
jgi:uncharacterized repeat protein (TIGR03803 family)